MNTNTSEPDDDTMLEVLPFHAWEYRLVSSGTIMKGGMMAKLNRLGRSGWEIIGFASADKTIGLNSLEVLLKRPLMADGELVAAANDPEHRSVALSERELEDDPEHRSVALSERELEDDPEHRSVALSERELELDGPATLPDSEFDCVECGVEVPPSAESCPACGWSWT